MEGFTLHGLRHYALTQIAKTDVLAAQRIAGHTSLVVTQSYLHADPSYVREKYDRADPLGTLLGEPKTAKEVLVNPKAEKEKAKRLALRQR